MAKYSGSICGLSSSFCLLHGKGSRGLVFLAQLILRLSSLKFSDLNSEELREKMRSSFMLAEKQETLEKGRVWMRHSATINHPIISLGLVSLSLFS